MILDRLDLIAFGGFTGETLAFGAEPGLHLVYGPNEAGKSTTRRAVQALLFGIPRDTVDDFLHERRKMRIGGKLIDDQGGAVEIVRRRGTKRALFAADDKTPLDGERIAETLGDLAADEFARFFNVDHEQLERGGREVLERKGQLGPLLFAAAGGLDRLRKLETELRDASGNRFKRTGKNPTINQGLEEIRQLEVESRAATLSLPDWERIEQDLAAAETRSRRLAEEATDLRRRQGRVQRLQRTRTVAAELLALAEERDRLGHGPTLAEDFAARRGQAETAAARAEAALETLAEQRQRLADELAELPADDDAILAHADEVRELANRHPVVAAQINRMQRQKEALDRVRADGHRLLAELGPQAHGAGGGSVSQARVRALAADYTGIQRKVHEGRQRCGDFQRRRAALQAELQPLGVVAEEGPLAEAVHAAVALQSQAEALPREQLELSQGWERVRAEAAALGLGPEAGWSDRVASAPDGEAIEAYSELWQERETERQRLAQQRAGLTAETARIAAARQRLTAEGDPPSPAELQAARRARDELWRTLSASEQAPSDAQRREFTRRIEAADELADRLREQAERVARRERLEADAVANRIELQEVDERLRFVDEAFEALREEWASLWSPTGIVPQPPRGMQAWLRRQQRWEAQWRDVRRREGELAEVGQAVAAVRDRLRAVLGPTSDPVADALPDWIERAEQALRALRRKRERRDRGQAALADVERSLASEEAALAAAEEELRDWQTRWTEAAQRLGLAAGATPAEVEALLERLQRLDRGREREAELTDDVAAAEAEVETYRERLSRLMQAVGEPEDGAPSIDALRRRLDTAEATRRRREQLSSKARELAEQRARAEENGRAAAAELTQLAGQIGCSPESLAETAAVCRRRGEIDARVRELRQRLTLDAAGESLEAFQAEALAFSPEEGAREAAELTERVSAIEEQRTACDQEIGALRRERERLDGESRAAELEQRKAGVAAGLQAEIEAYLRETLAAELLSRAIERYRRANQGPVLARASEIFRRTTRGSFARLDVAFEDADSTLVGVRAGSEDCVPVGGMSQGTRDQLYLALRLASLEHLLGRSRPLPVVVDDVLINFDDDRAGATLGVLAELGRRTQVIYFTHHRHLLEIAGSALGPGCYQVHWLGASPDAVPPPLRNRRRGAPTAAATSPSLFDV